MEILKSIESKIVNTLINFRRQGISKTTLRLVSYNLKFLSKYCDLDNPESVKDFISKHNVDDSYKKQLVRFYNHYCRVNGIKWCKPKYRDERRLPKVPAKEQLEKIIASCGKYFGAILRVLMETGIMPHELSRMKVSDIDSEKGIARLHVKCHAEE